MKSLQFESMAEELDFEFDDAPDTGGRRPNFSDPPTWYVQPLPRVCLVLSC